MAEVRNAGCSPLNKKPKSKCQDWAEKYVKTDFSKVLQTDEMRVTLDGSDGRVPGWISNGPRAPLRLRSARWRWGTDMGCYYLRWANWTFSGWRWTQNQLPNLLPVSEDILFQAVVQQKKVCVFQEDAYDFYAWQCSIASDERIMTWPPSSPDLDPIENLWVLLQWEIYSEGN